MPESTLRSLVRIEWARMFILVFFVIALASHALQPVLAQTQVPRSDPSRDFRGMLIFKIPFGYTRNNEPLTPELGFSFSVRKPEEERYKPDRYDRRTGALLPDFDMDRVPTWSLNELEPLADGLSRPWSGPSAPYEDPAGPNARIRGLSEYGLPVITDR